MPKKQSRQNKKQARVRSENIIRNGYRASNISAQKYLNMASPIQTDLDTARDASVEELRRDGFRYIAVNPKNK